MAKAPPLLPTEVLRRVLRVAHLDGLGLLAVAGAFALVSAGYHDTTGTVADGNINVNAGAKLVPFSGQATSGAAGLATSTTISTPGASLTEVWDSVEWTTW